MKGTELEPAGMREQILSAAETLFDQQGYANTTVERIVELAG